MFSMDYIMEEMFPQSIQQKVITKVKLSGFDSIGCVLQINFQLN